MDWDDADVRAILELVDAAGFDELSIETDRFTLSLRRGEGGAGWTRESRTIGTDAPTPAAAVREVDIREPERAQDDNTPLVAVKTPLPGTFYRSPKPGAPPFVEVGTRVTQQTVVAIIETMKLMNSVYAGVTGRIVNIAVADGCFVPQGAVIMQVEPGGDPDGP